jgi:hypothetical protein
MIKSDATLLIILGFDFGFEFHRRFPHDSNCVLERQIDDESAFF